MESTHDKGSVVFNTQTINHDYWDIYLDARPTYSPRCYEIIYDYHKTLGSDCWALAEDVGTG